MSLKIKAGVDLAKSFEKLKSALMQAKEFSLVRNAWDEIEKAVCDHLDECTEESKPTENDVPKGLFETFGDIFNPNKQ